MGQNEKPPVEGAKKEGDLAIKRNAYLRGRKVKDKWVEQKKSAVLPKKNGSKRYTGGVPQT